jgi:hypothetical protein
MKNILYIFGIYFLISCKSDTKNNIPKTENKDNVINIIKPESDLNGVWGLNNYFDNILADKQIAKHRLQTPSWFAIMIEIKNDSILSYGSIFNLKQQINYKSDTLTIFKSLGSEYILLKKNNELTLKQIPNEDRIDSTVYSFRKRNDLNKLLKNQNTVHKISDRITEYFNENLLTGEYINPKNKKVITFKKNGDLINFEGFDKYNVRNYFGTLHPHNNLDVLTLKNSSTNKLKQLNWKILSDKLILTEFIPEIVTRFGKKTMTDNYVLGKKKIELIIKKH